MENKFTSALFSLIKIFTKLTFAIHILFIFHYIYEKRVV